MSDRTRIQWCDATWNPIVGCTPVSEGCAHCYAARMAKRLAGRCGYPKDFSEVTTRQHVLGQPCSWKNPRRIFTCSMGDLFHERVNPADRFSVFNVMRGCPRHTFLVLTKRPELISPSIEWPSNVWLGVTVENQEMADARIPMLLKVEAAVRFVSIEPLLGPVYLPVVLPVWISWVIVGGETGPGARPMHPDWVRSIRDQCVTAGVPFFFKHWGEYCVTCDSTKMVRVGHKMAGSLLDGREWDEFPEVS